MGEAHLRRRSAGLGLGRAFGQLLRDMVKHCFPCGELIKLVLREIANAQRSRGFAIARHKGQALGNGFDQGCLALAVRADNGDAVIRVQAQVHAREDLRAFAVAKVGVF